CQRLFAEGIFGESWLCAGVFPAQSFDFFDELRHSGHRIFLALIFGGHEALIAVLVKELPDAVEIQGSFGLAVEIPNVSVSGPGETGLDLLVGVLAKVTDVEVAARERRIDATQDFQNIGSPGGKS